MYSNECFQEIPIEIISLASQFYSRIWYHLSTTKGRIILSFLRTTIFFFFLFCKNRKDSFWKCNISCWLGLEKKSFYFLRYCHLVDKGNSFKTAHRNMSLYYHKMAAHNQVFKMPARLKTFRVLLLQTEWSIPTEEEE